MVQVQPAELGRVAVGIVRAPGSPARVELQAERPDTLRLLMADQPALHRALDLAGIPAEGRTLHFQLGPADAPLPPPAPPPSTAAGGEGSGSSGGGGGRQGPPPGWEGSGTGGGGDAPPPLRPHRAARRTGIDITA